MSRSRPLVRPKGRHATLIARALAHVESNLDHRLDADTLADHAAMSRFHFHRLFRAQVGCSVAAYVSWRRLQRACALLVSGREPVLEVALSVGYESAQALAKAMRRELDTTPGAVRRGESIPWTSLLVPDRLPLSHTPVSPPGEPTMEPTRFSHLPPGLFALTATARGMVGHSMARAAQAAFKEVVDAVVPGGQVRDVASFIAIAPDEPQGPDDPHCRYVAGLVFGHDLARGQGTCLRPDLPLSGSLAWQDLDPGRYAVFTHIGPYDTLHRSWRAIYADWLPASGERLRDAPPMELCLNDPKTTPSDSLHTEIWVPLLG